MMEVSYVAFSPDDKYVVSTSRDHALDIWNAQTGEHLHTLTGPTEHIVFTSFSPDGKQVASVSYDNTVHIWNTQTGDSVLVLQHDGKQSFYSSLAFSPNGKRLATTIINGINCIWDIQTGAKIISFDEITSIDFAICYSPDGKYIATASMDGFVYVWDATTGKKIETFEFTPFEDFPYLSFDSSGQRIIISSENGMLRTYDFPPLQELIDETRERFKDRPLTPEERRKYYLE